MNSSVENNFIKHCPFNSLACQIHSGLLLIFIPSVRPTTQMSLSTPTLVARSSNLKTPVATCISANGKPPGTIRCVHVYVYVSVCSLEFTLPFCSMCPSLVHLSNALMSLIKILLSLLILYLLLLFLVFLIFKHREPGFAGGFFC